MNSHAEAAIRDYIDYRHRMEAEARVHELQNRPLTARVWRQRARIVAKASLAERIDPEPVKP